MDSHAWDPTHINNQPGVMQSESLIYGARHTSLAICSMREGGMGCAWYLSQKKRKTLLELADRG